MAKKTYIQTLFNNINGGDCVDSAALAQEVAEQLLVAAKLGLKELGYRAHCDERDMRAKKAYAIIENSIALAEGK